MITLAAKHVPVRPGDLRHVHGCPVCHEHYDCAEHCAIEPDLGTHRGLPTGDYIMCDECEERTAFARLLSDEVWWEYEACGVTSLLVGGAEAREAGW